MIIFILVNTTCTLCEWLSDVIVVSPHEQLGLELGHFPLQLGHHESRVQLLVHADVILDQRHSLREPARRDGLLRNINQQ